MRPALSHQSKLRAIVASQRFNQRIGEAMVSHIQLLYEEYERVYKASAVLPTIHVADFVNSGQQHSEHRTKCNIFSHACLGSTLPSRRKEWGREWGCGSLRLRCCAVPCA